MPKILENPREKILIEAKVILKENGYEALSMRKLAKNCDIGIGTVYNYFKNKYSIATEIVRLDWSTAINDLDKIKLLEISFEKKMRRIYDELNSYLANHIDIFLDLYKEEKTKPDHCSDNILGPLYLIVDEIITYHRERGELNINLETRNLSKFIITNMVTIVKSNAFSFEDLMVVLTHK
ncbi:MAG: TetR/AcrR family transcriptional regulator [Clostridium sp.]|uniref:TetR/AcrR family transcriptional regulator n=1 Tax=Clostridium sp. TaxID=1506 RepID=UPI003F37B803